MNRCYMTIMLTLLFPMVVSSQESEVHMCASFRPFEDEQAEAATVSVVENPLNLPTAQAREFYGVPAPGASGISSTAGISTGVLLLPYKWKAGDTIPVSFMNGTPRQKELTQKFALQWREEAGANITFKFLSEEGTSGKIRISYTPDNTSWSMLGTSALMVAKDKPTMNFGWFHEDTSEEEYSRTVLHEFGHALGLAHEHMNPTAEIQWKRSAVYAHYRAMGWSDDQIERNVLSVLSKNQTNYTKFDPKSIMLYAIPASMTEDGFSVGWNTTLSSTDRQFIAAVYPGL